MYKNSPGPYTYHFVILFLIVVLGLLSFMPIYNPDHYHIRATPLRTASHDLIKLNILNLTIHTGKLIQINAHPLGLGVLEYCRVSVSKNVTVSTKWDFVMEQPVPSLLLVIFSIFE